MLMQVFDINLLIYKTHHGCLCEFVNIIILKSYISHVYAVQSDVDVCHFVWFNLLKMCFTRAYIICVYVFIHLLSYGSCMTAATNVALM